MMSFQSWEVRYKLRKSPEVQESALEKGGKQSGKRLPPSFPVHQFPQGVFCLWAVLLYPITIELVEI